MRPPIIDPLFANIRTLGGVGPKFAPLYDRLLADGDRDARIIDMLFHIPRGGIDRSQRPKVIDVPYDQTVTVEVTVEEHRPPPPGRARAPFRVLTGDDTGDLTLVFFGMKRGQVERMLPVGARRWVSGEVALYDGTRQMVHPSRILDEKGLAAMPPVEPLYALTEGISPRVLHKAALAALAKIPALPEWISPGVLKQRGWPDFASAMQQLHSPKTLGDVDENGPAVTRLAYDELLASQLALLLIRARNRKSAGRSSAAGGVLKQKIADALPFSLTQGQLQALAEIEKDIASDERMLRLLQGDVGSGKTIVGLMAMACIVEAGRQAAMMAPTEILARQHFERIAPLAAAAGIRCALLTGRDRARERSATIAGLADGSIGIVIGTHALFQDSVAFKDLALAIIDEQHRFGVHQRLALSRKGDHVDLLVMTATPIPRTLVLTYFGDMDVSSLREKPAGRQPVETRIVPFDRMGELTGGLRRAVASGARVYWVCPLIEESELTDATAAEDRFRALQAEFGGQVGLVHGRLPGPEKDAAVAAFAAGDTKILVATTVIEVGVDIPSASVMVVEQAERFGLAQLHQLRGRVGRGAAKSSCVLLYKGPLSEVSQSRLAIMRETDDGFLIAEEDLKLRGEGEILGARQSGSPGFRVARLPAHTELLKMARDDAEIMLRGDPRLAGERGEALRLLLYLFERDAAAPLMAAG